MVQRIVRVLITFALFIIYFKLFGFLWNVTGISSIAGDLAVLFATLVVLLACGILSVVTSEQLMRGIRG